MLETMRYEFEANQPLSLTGQGTGAQKPERRERAVQARCSPRACSGPALVTLGLDQLLVLPTAYMPTVCETRRSGVCAHSETQSDLYALGCYYVLLCRTWACISLVCVSVLKCVGPRDTSPPLGSPLDVLEAPSR